MIIAHRGIHNNENLPENSLKAFDKAVKKGYGIEFDIEITKDDKLVIHHDHNFYRMTGVNKEVKKTTLKEIKDYKLINTSEKIPTFKELLNLVDGKVFLDIEVKTTKKVNKITDLILKELEGYKGELSLKSFNPKIVNSFNKKTDRYKVGLLISEHNKSKLLSFLVKTKLIYKFTKFDFLAPDKRMLEKKYFKKYIDKYPIYAWTINGLKEAKEITSKYPSVVCICNDLD